MELGCWKFGILSLTHTHTLLFCSLSSSLVIFFGTFLKMLFPLVCLEHEILERKDHRHESLPASDSKEELQQSILVRMKSVTNAHDDVCVALLEENNYDLKTSIEAFFHSS